MGTARSFRRTATAALVAALAIGSPASADEGGSGDPSLRRDADHAEFYTEPTPPAPPRRTLAPRLPVARLADTFALHSNPGAAVTILIDVDGHKLSGTVWDTLRSLLLGSYPAWDPGKDGPTFSAGEQLLVQEVWRRVAEDYAPFDVDVTTEDPGEAALTRADDSDTEYGVRALVTPSVSALSTLCGSCGGIAYVDSIGDPYYSPAWVFSRQLFDDPGFIAEAVSHEIGHTLGLHHDGGAASSYYEGHGRWAPIMGSSYSRSVTQWSKGDYPGATNHEDDVAILAERLGRRPDEAGSGPARATRMRRSASGFITSRADADAFFLGSCRGRITLVAKPALQGPDLDIRLRVLDARGRVLRSSSPSSLGAELTVRRTGQRTYVRVDGVGSGTTATGYDDYGSLGGYRITRSGTCR